MDNTTRAALVTGGNKGIGFAVARRLAEQGYTTWLGSRDEARGRAAVKALAGAGDVRFILLDVTDDASVAAAVANIGARTPALDVVMVGAGLGSLTLQMDPSQGLSRWPAFAYSSSKTALNALTVGFANELRDDGIVVSVVNPGFVATDLNGHTGALTTDEGAERVMRATQLPLSATGRFITDDGTLPW